MSWVRFPSPAPINPLETGGIFMTCDIETRTERSEKVGFCEGFLGFKPLTKSLTRTLTELLLFALGSVDATALRDG